MEDDTLVVRDFQGCDAISTGTDGLGNPVYGYRYHINLASRDPGLTAVQVVDHTALLEIIRDGFVLQRVHGIVRNFSRGDTGHHHSFYSLTLVPSLERLALRRNSRSFQDLTVPEILSILMKEMEINDYIDGIKRTCAKREFCVQYRESDLEFFHRLAAEEGIMYSFIHQKDKHILLLTDDPEGFPTRDEPVLYNNLSGGVNDLPYISSLSEHYQSQPNTIQMQDYSFKKPGYNFKQTAEAVNINQLETYEYFDHPGRFKDDGNGKAFTQFRLEALRREYHTATGKSDQPRLQAGLHFYVGDHFDPAMNRDWIVVASSHQGSQPQALEEDGSTGATTYSNQFKLIPGDQVWRAMPQPKPQVDGPCIATVVGPDGEEIYCDEYGRVKLHFPWDRYSNTDDKSSCWIRVAQGWAGPQYGTVMIPRIGHEVVVSFLNGDPDQPVVTGRTYHASNQAPYALPDNKTKTVLRTETHQGEGYNELSFEDQSGSEQIFLTPVFDWKNNEQCEVTFAGIFDTVAAIAQMSHFDFTPHNTRNGKVRLWLDPKRVKHAVHLTASSQTEYRYNFCLNRFNPAKNFHELSLPGAHSDIGGGYFSRQSFEPDFLLPLFEHKQIAQKTQIIDDDWFSEREYQRVKAKLTEKLQKTYQMEAEAGWNMADYQIRFKKQKRKRGNSDRSTEWKITGELYIQRIVEGDLSRLYLRVMYGLAEFYGVPIKEADSKEKTPVWDKQSESPNTKYYQVPDTLFNPVTQTKFPFGELCQQALQLAKQGDVASLHRLLENKQLLTQLVQLNLVHHSSSTGIANPPNIKHGHYEREVFACSKND